MLDLDRAIAERALARKLVSEGELTRCERILAERRATGAKAYLAQVLVQERVLDPRSLIELQDDLGAAIYECPKCAQRHSAIELGSGKTFSCKGCGQQVRLKAADRKLSQVEVLASRDPRDLSVTLRLAEDSGSASLAKVNEVDLTRYKVEGELGRGGYGVVFQATDTQMDRRIALKVLKATQDLSNTTLERFIREGRAASKLQHPNICQVYDIGRSKDVVALAMELVKGSSLRDRVQQGPIPWREACEIQLGILAGVQHAHEHGVIHRDLKPANVILEEGTGRPRLIDFGLAKDVSASVDLTGAGQILGTPFYLAPEQVEGRSHKVDARSDVFALGVIFYEQLTGKRPFLAKSRNEVYAKILHDEPAPPSELVPELPESLDVVIAKALAKVPEERFQTAAAFAAAVKDAIVAADEPKTSKKPTKKTTRPLARSAARRVPSEPALAASKSSAVATHVALAVAGVLVVVLVLALSRSSPPPSKPEVAVQSPPPPPPPPPAPAPVAAPVPAPAPEPAPAPAPDPVPDPVAAPVPAPDPVPVPAPAPDPVPAPAPDPVPPPSPAAVAPVNSALALDDGAGDEKEFPSLHDKTTPDWIARAFATNAIAEGPRTPASIRALRYALLDREPLVRAFALRGLMRRAIDDLKAWGSKALFDRLIANLAVKKGVLPYVPTQARKLLAALAGQDLGEKPEPWRAWWTATGAADFAAVREARPAQAPVADAAPPAPTQEKEAARYLTQARDQGLDAVICMDVTLSMTDTLKRVKAQVRELTSFFTLLGREAKVPARLGYVTYGDEVVKWCPLVENLNEYARAVDQIEIFNDPNDHTVEEGPDRAIKKAMLDGSAFKWRPKARKVLVLIGDAPMHEPDEKDCYALVKEQSKKHGFLLNALICEPPKKYASNPKWLPHREFTELAELTGGLATELKDPEEVITQLLVLLLGSKFEEDVRRFVHAYREVVPPG